LIVDKDTFFEIGKTWGTTIVVGLARLEGYPIGIIATDSSIMGGALTALGSLKLRRHIDMFVN